MKIKNIFAVAAAFVGLTLGSCSPDDNDMPAKNVAAGDLVEGIAYTITHDEKNPNIVYLDSRMPSDYAVYWEHPQGRSQESHIELRLPFEGDYTVRFGVETRGGLVYGEPAKFTISSFCADFVTDELWTCLTGGVGKAKEWVYDNGQYGQLSGELSYGDPSANPNLGWNSFNGNWDPGAGHCGDDAMWQSTMTFDLIGGANYSFYNSTKGTTQTGKFTLDTNSHTLNFTDADLMHPDSWTERNADWRRNLKIIELDDNHMRVGYVRQPGNWGGEWVEVFNYVSKEYAESYQPPVIETEPRPTLDAAWLDLFTSQVRYCTWKLSADDPYNWFELDGTAKRDVVGGGYPAGYEPIELENALTIKFTSPAADDYTVSLPDGSTVAGKYSAAVDGMMTLTNGVGNAQIGNGGIEFATFGQGNFQVISYSTDDLGRMSDIWLGRKLYDVQGKPVEYLGYHFLANYGGEEKVTYKATLNFNNTGDWTMVTGDAVYVEEGTYTVAVNYTWTQGDPLLWLNVNKFLKDHPNGDIVITEIKVDGQPIEFNDADISRGAGDSPDIARRYICNAWGLAACFPSLDIFKAQTGFEVTFRVIYDNGTPFVTE